MHKTMIFTVTESTGVAKPIAYAQLVNSDYKNDQGKAEKLILSWAKDNLELYDNDQLAGELEELAYNMRHDGYAWFDERYCFELTEVYG